MQPPRHTAGAGAQDRLTSKILNFLTVEAGKAGNREKLRCVVDPVLLCLAQAARPYVIAVLVVLTLLATCQGVLCYRVFSLERALRQ